MTDLLEAVSEGLVRQGLRLVLAESCTGGILAARLTDRPGASRFLDAGLVVYSNEAKETLLGVDRATLVEHGAVSEQVAREMLTGALDRTGAHAAVTITGIAGPDGGTPEKPVGTVWIGVAVEDKVRLDRYVFDGGRIEIRERAVDTALTMLNRLLASP